MGNLLHEHHNVVDLNACHGAKGTEKTEKIVKNRRADTQNQGDQLVHTADDNDIKMVLNIKE